MDTLNVLPISAFRDNYIWCLERSGQAVVVDPGEAAPVLAHLVARGLRLAAILVTHHHPDHTGGCTELKARFDVPVFGPAREHIPALTHRLDDGAQVDVPGLGTTLEVLDIPGHTAGHIAFHGAGMLFCGDTLFACGCGRLFEGTPAQMWTSLGRLAALPAQTRVYCGHEYTLANIAFARQVEPGNSALHALGEEAARLRREGLPTLPSTIGAERATNPFLRAGEPAVAQRAAQEAGRPLPGPVDVFTVLREWKNRA